MKHKINIEFMVESTQVEAQYLRDSIERFAFDKAESYRAGISARSGITSHLGRIADLESALKSPFDYEVSFGPLGWQLQYVGESIATVISREDAEKFISASQTANSV